MTDRILGLLVRWLGVACAWGVLAGVPVGVAGFYAGLVFGWWK